MKAAILEKIGAPLMVADIDLPEKLERGQVLVKVLCTGICGSQLQEIDGIKGDPAHLPHLLGHEGCGIVQDIGEGVTTVQKGDKVVMHWRKGEGIEAEPAVYFREPLPFVCREVKAGPITTFSEYAVVSENRVTAVADDVPNDFAALLGCALSTALSVIEKEAKIKIGDRIAIIGCGGVGLSLIFALMIGNPDFFQVVGIDITVFPKELVERMGAQFQQGISDKIYDIVIDTVRNDASIFELKTGGRYISLQPGGTSGGNFNPAFDIPRYCELFRNTASRYGTIITHRISLDQINDGIQLMREGKAGRVMIEM